MALTPAETGPNSPVGGWLALAERRLESLALRIFLSVLILISVLPPKVSDVALEWWFLFLGVFGAEFLLRACLLLRRRRRFELRSSELGLLLLDFLALISFLPFFAANLQVLRLARLLLLFGYWRGLLRELWQIVTRRERRYQIVLVLILGAVLAFGSAVLLIELGPQHDFDGDQRIDQADQSFPALLWWSFRQIQDPGNLVQSRQDPQLVAISLLLTFSGLLLFSFIIGIGTTVVGELVERARLQPLGLSGHSVILGASSYSGILLRELAQAYRKNSRSFSVAMMADGSTQDQLLSYVGRPFRFRPGDPSRVEDLDRVSVERAKRVIVLGSDSRDPDAEVISAILAVRQRHPSVPLYPDLEHERNFPAARAAGGRETHLVGSGSMLGYYLAQNVAYPGVHHLYRHLLQSSDGCEIYTYIFSADERRRIRQRARMDLAALHRTALEHHTTLLGFFVAEDPEAEIEDADLEVLLHPLRALLGGLGEEASFAIDASARLDGRHLRGVIGIAPAFSDLARLGERIHSGRLPSSPHDSLEAAADEPAFSGLRLASPRQPAESVLILGAGPRVPRVVMELIGFFQRLEITVLAGAGEPFRELVHDVQAMLGGGFSEKPRLEEIGDQVVRLHLGTLSTITLLVADWTHGRLLEQAGAVTLAEADVILFLPSDDHDRDHDGRIALDCLHLAHLERTGAVRFKPGAHVLALVRDPAKGDLLEQRLIEMGGRHSACRRLTGCRYTVSSSERARHRFLMQSVFVRGLNSVYLRLLSSKGRYLSRVLPAAEDGGMLEGELELAALSRHLLARYRLLLVGYEGRGAAGEVADGAVVVHLEPSHLAVGHRVTWREIAALYVLGDGADITALADHG